jgi:hypothetical protein
VPVQCFKRGLEREAHVGSLTGRHKPSP